MTDLIPTTTDLDDTNDKLRRLARRVNDTLWDLDSARSLLRKASAGYRASSATGDVPWNVEPYRVRVQACHAKAERLLAELTGALEAARAA